MLTEEEQLEEEQQDALVRQMKDKVYQLSADVNDIQCMMLECKRCPFWVDGECTVTKINGLLTECLKDIK